MKLIYTHCKYLRLALTVLSLMWTVAGGCSKNTHLYGSVKGDGKSEDLDANINQDFQDLPLPEHLIVNNSRVKFWRYDSTKGVQVAFPRKIFITHLSKDKRIMFSISPIPGLHWKIITSYKSFSSMNNVRFIETSREPMSGILYLEEGTKPHIYFFNEKSWSLTKLTEVEEVLLNQKRKEKNNADLSNYVKIMYPESNTSQDRFCFLNESKKGDATTLLTPQQTASQKQSSTDAKIHYSKDKLNYIPNYFNGWSGQVADPQSFTLKNASEDFKIPFCIISQGHSEGMTSSLVDSSSFEEEKSIEQNYSKGMTSSLVKPSSFEEEKSIEQNYPKGMISSLVKPSSFEEEKATKKRSSCKKFKQYTKLEWLILHKRRKHYAWYEKYSKYEHSILYKLYKKFKENKEYKNYQQYKEIKMLVLHKLHELYEQYQKCKSIKKKKNGRKIVTDDILQILNDGPEPYDADVDN